MSKKSPNSMLLSKLWEKSNTSLTPLVYQQISHAALGTVSPEVDSVKNIPLQFCYNNSSYQYNYYAAIQRAQKFLDINVFEAMGIVEDVILQFKHEGLGVNQVQLLLDPTIDKGIRKAAFKALRKNLALNDEGAELSPKTATLALAKKQVPHPDTSWKGRFSLTGAYPNRGHSQLIEHVSNNECYLWMFPPAHNQATSIATLDHYSGDNNKPSAEMGMGFTIIQSPLSRDVFPKRHSSERNTYNHYVLYSPIWAWRASSDKWHLGNIVRTEIRDGDGWSETKLNDLLPGGLISLPRIYGCHTCRTFYVDRTDECNDMPTNCSCMELSLD